MFNKTQIQERGWTDGLIRRFLPAPLVEERHSYRYGNTRAADLRLSEQDLNRIEQALPKGSVAGERYAPAMMKIVNR